MKVKEISKLRMEKTSWGYERKVMVFPKLGISADGPAKDMANIDSYAEAKVIAYLSNVMGTIFLFKGAIKYFAYYASPFVKTGYSGGVYGTFGRFQKISDAIAMLRDHGKILDKEMFGECGKIATLEAI